MRLGAALACTLLVAACASKKEGAAGAASPTLPADSPNVVLMISADVRGYVGPCGCSENMQGGIARAAEQVLRARKEGVPLLYLDGGNTLFGTDQQWPREIPQEERRAQALAQAMKRMGIAAKAVGRFDLARGDAFERALQLPDVDGVRVLEAAARRIGVVSAKTVEELAALGRRARADGAQFVVGFVELELPKAQQQAERARGAVDLIVATYSPGWFDAEENRLVRGDVPVAAVQSKGRSLLRVDLAFLAGEPGAPFSFRKSGADKDSELRATDERIELLREQTNDPTLPKPAREVRQRKLEELILRREQLARAEVAPPGGQNSFGLRFVVLESNLPSDPQTAELVEQYDRDVSKLNFAWAQRHGQDCPPPAVGEAAFVGNGSCETCHAQTFPVWRESKHAHAYATLEQKGKQYHLDCVGCHVTGFERSGGVCRVDKVEGRRDVGCESCHGPGSLHAVTPRLDNIIAKPTEKDCVGCHNPENSPHFEFVRYLPQVLGPGHQADGVNTGPR